MQLKNVKHENGFTLIELMIVVVIMGILAAVAVPQYTQYVIRANRAAAQSFMMDIASRQKQYLLDARAYAPTVATLAMSEPPEVTKNYTIAICLDAACTPATSPPSFKITATPIAGKPQAEDGALTLDDANTKTPVAKW